MAREVTLIILGMLVALSPYLGLPIRVLAVLLPILGITIAVLGLVARVSEKRNRSALSLSAYGPET